MAFETLIGSADHSPVQKYKRCRTQSWLFSFAAESQALRSKLDEAVERTNYLLIYYRLMNRAAILDNDILNRRRSEVHAAVGNESRSLESLLYIFRAYTKRVYARYLV